MPDAQSGMERCHVSRSLFIRTITVGPGITPDLLTPAAGRALAG